MPAKPEAPDPNQALADLRWVVESPAFVGGEQVEPATELGDLGDIDADHLVAFLAERWSHRVGRYFEALVEYWLRHVRKVEVIGCGMQLREGKRTVGELDFVFRDAAGELTHWEVAVKFFLHHPNDHGSHFPGPNVSDSYERKVAKLLGPQLGASKVHMPEVTKRRAFVKGQMFYHPAVGEPAVLPDNLPAGHVRGSWLRCSELDELAGIARGGGTIVRKPLWLAPEIAAPLSDPRQLATALHAHFADHDHPLMVSLRDPDDASD